MAFKASSYFDKDATSASGGGDRGVITVDSDKGLLINNLQAVVTYPDYYNSGYQIGPVGGYYATKGAYQFTVNSSFSLSQIDLYLETQNTYNNSSMRVSLFTSDSNGPTGSVLGISNTLNLPNGSQLGITSFMFSTPVSLTAQQYVAVIEFVFAGDMYNDSIRPRGANYNWIDNTFSYESSTWSATNGLTAYIIGYARINGTLELKLKTNSGLNMGPSGLALNSVTGPMGVTGIRGVTGVLGYTGVQGITGASGTGGMNPIVAALVFG